MNCLRRETREAKDPLRLYSQPEFRCPVLVVAWTEDAGKLGPKTIDYLRHKLGCQRFCEIEPVEFFPMGGVAVEDDLVQFPESSFYGSCEADLLLFKSMPPSSNWHQFLSLLFDNQIADRLNLNLCDITVLQKVRLFNNISVWLCLLQQLYKLAWNLSCVNVEYWSVSLSNNSRVCDNSDLSSELFSNCSRA